MKNVRTVVLIICCALLILTGTNMSAVAQPVIEGWSVTATNPYSGVYSIEASTGLNDNESGYVEITLDCQDGDISFWYAVSSESGYDFLIFSIDGVSQRQWSGDVPWAQASFAVSQGTHTFTWAYDKDDSESYELDTAWLDDIQISEDGVGIVFYEGFESGYFSQDGWTTWVESAVPSGSISGIVTDADTGEPIFGASVYASGLDEPLYGSSSTDDSGLYTISGLSEGDYMVIVMTPDLNYANEYYNDANGDVEAVTVGTGNTPGIDFELEKGGRISGMVTDGGGAGIQEMIVYAFTDCPGERPVAGAMTGEDGAYTLLGVPAGNVYLLAYAHSGPFYEDFASEWYDGAASCEDAETVSVTVGESTEGINFQLEEGGFISGTVYESDGVTPVPYMMVHLFSDQCGEVSIGTAYSDEYGEYSISNVFPGDVYVQVSTYVPYPSPISPPLNFDTATGYLGEWYDDALSCEAAEALTISPGGEASGIDFALSDDTDTDVDGMPDAWEMNYFGDLSRDGNGDFDEDQTTDLEEYQAGTNPDDEIPENVVDDGDDDGGGGGGGCFISNLF